MDTPRGRGNGNRSRGRNRVAPPRGGKRNQSSPHHAPQEVTVRNQQVSSDDQERFVPDPRVIQEVDQPQSDHRQRSSSTHSSNTGYFGTPRSREPQTKVTARPTYQTREFFSAGYTPRHRVSAPVNRAQHQNQHQDMASGSNHRQPAVSGFDPDQLLELAEVFGNLQVQGQAQALELVASKLNKGTRIKHSELPKYDGKKSFHEYRLQMEAAFQMKDYPDDRLIQALFQNINTDLHFWLLNHDQDRVLMGKDYDAAVDFLSRMFPEKMTNRRRRALFREINQGDETVTDYFNKKLDKARELGLAEDDFFYESVVAGLKNTQVRHKMKHFVEDELFNPITFESKLRAVDKKIKERARSPANFSFRPGDQFRDHNQGSSSSSRSRNRFRDQDPRSDRSGDDRSKSRDRQRSVSRGRPSDSRSTAASVCWTCGQPGHQAAQCPNQRFGGVFPIQPFNQPYYQPVFNPYHLMTPQPAAQPMVAASLIQPAPNDIQAGNGSHRQSEGQLSVERDVAHKSILK